MVILDKDTRSQVKKKSIYKQEDNNAHGLIILSNYLLTAEKRKEDIRDIDKVLLSIKNASQFAIKNYYRPEINLFHSTTSIHESALEKDSAAGLILHI
jgi:hypothetical protein